MDGDVYFVMTGRIRSGVVNDDDVLRSFAASFVVAVAEVVVVILPVGGGVLGFRRGSSSFVKVVAWPGGSLL